MLKLGVWRPDQFYPSSPSGLMRRAYYRLSRSRVSLGLLPVARNPRPADTELFERLMPHVRLSNGVYRTTYRRRFRELDPLVNGILATELANVPNPRIEDWAASACYTSLEWFRSLVPLFPRLSFTASDLFTSVIAVQQPGKLGFWVVEESGSPLQFVRPPFVLRLDPPEPWMLPVNAGLGRFAHRRWQELREQWVTPVWSENADAKPLAWNGFELTRLPLIHPDARRMTAEDTRFGLRQHSVFEQSPARCHVVRTMNILNRAYFSDETLLCGARAVVDSLEPGGIWILGRTIQEEPAVHEVSILRKEHDGRLTVIHRVGPGSEAESTVMAHDAFRTGH